MATTTHLNRPPVKCKAGFDTGVPGKSLVLVDFVPTGMFPPEDAWISLCQIRNTHLVLVILFVIIQRDPHSPIFGI